jgi:hypothetical protein
MVLWHGDGNLGGASALLVISLEYIPGSGIIRLNGGTFNKFYNIFSLLFVFILFFFLLNYFYFLISIHNT